LDVETPNTTNFIQCHQFSWSQWRCWFGHPPPLEILWTVMHKDWLLLLWIFLQ
jgi:hypothetical protein